MRALGRYVQGQDLFVFDVIVGKPTSGISISLFRSKINIDNETIDLSADLIYPTWSDKAKEALICHIITKKTLQVKFSYGDLTIAKLFLKDLNACNFFDLMSKAKYLEDLNHLSNNLKVTKFSPIYDTVRRQSFLNYVTAEDNDISLELRKHRVRSLEDLKSIYDLSWILDENDNLKRDYRCICTEQELDELIDIINSHTLFGYDVETTGLEIHYYGGDRSKSDYMHGFGLSWGKDHAAYIPFKSNKFETLTKEQVMPKILPLLEHKDLMMANGAFDIRATYHEGYYLENTYDPIVAAYIEDPEGSRGHKSLKALSREYCNEETLELDEVCGGVVDGKLMWDMDKIVLTIYGCADVEQLFRVREVQEPYTKPFKLAFNHDLKIQPVVAMADYYGAYIDTELLGRIRDSVEEDLHLVEDIMWKYLEYKLPLQIVKQALTISFNQKGITFTDEDFARYQKTNPETVTQLLESETTKQIYDSWIHHNYDNEKKRKKYLFSSNPDLSKILYNYLKYPVVSKEPNTNDETLNKLSLGFPTKHGDVFLKEDVKTSASKYNFGFAPKQEVLISKAKFEEKQFPFAYLIQVYRSLFKQKTSFCDVLLNQSVDGWYAPVYNTTYAATGRMTCPIQTIQKFYKHAVVTYPGMAGVNADAKQIELRVMAGLGNNLWKEYLDLIKSSDLKTYLEEFSMDKTIEKISLPWADYHRESCCKMFNTTPEKITREMRSKGKVANFTMPFDGSGEAVNRSKLTGVVSQKERAKIIAEGDELKNLWSYHNMPVSNFLNSTRDLARTPITDRSKLPLRLQPEYMGDYGMVENIYGRRRIFDLNYDRRVQAMALADGLTLKLDSPAYKEYAWRKINMLKSSIGREAGNLPIQGTAADFYKISLRALYDRLRAEGLIGGGPGKEKFIITQLVHDEFTGMYDKSLHPFYIYKLIKESCMLNIPGHPTYYWGVSLIDCWYDGKEDENDAPLEFLTSAIELYEKHKDTLLSEDYMTSPKAYVRTYMIRFMKLYALKYLTPYIKDGVLYYDIFLRDNSNYFLTSSICDYSHKVTSNLEAPANDTTLLYLSSSKWDKVKYNGKLYNKSSIIFTVDKETKADTSQELDFNFEDDFIEELQAELEEYEVNNAILDRPQMNFISETPLGVLFNDDEEDEIKTEEKASHVGLIDIGGKYCVDISKLSKQRFNLLNQYLLTYRSDSGLPIVFIYNGQQITTDWKISSNFNRKIIDDILRRD